MMADQLQLEKTIFHGARVIASAEERSAYLAQACGEDHALRERIDALLKVHETEPSRGGDDAPASSALFEKFAPSVDEPPGTIIGRYKLLERVGEGGFGVVYMAEQQFPIRRQVALKVIKAGLDTKQVIARFEAERQALAMMDHENIAKVLDAGANEAGRPYFVMELVHGVPITRYCDDNQLTPRARLELFVKVCRAVQHAHTKGIIHRDLKPTNVLITLHDGVPVPKVIDFGVAKATGQQPLTDRTLFTQFAQMVGTPLYMSPEQAEMRGLDVDTRSDVYSLGVLLYELLTGTTPFDKERVKRVAHDEVRRIIREEEPPSPSTRISALGDKLATVSAHCKTDPKRLGQLVRGELDWIAMKALEKDRTRRYETANGLARDIERYLNNEPVVAREPSAGYLLRRLAARHRAAVAIAAAALVAIVAALGLAVWQRQVAVGAQRRAETRFRDVRQLSQALIFKLHDSVAKLPGSTPVRRQIVDEALVYLERLAQESADDLTLRMELGGAYRQIASILGDPAFPNLGDPEGALVQARKSLAMLDTVARAHDVSPKAVASLVDTLTLLRRLYSNAGDRAQALAMAEDAVRVSQRALDRGLDGSKTLLARSTFSLAGMVMPLDAKIPHWQRTAQLYDELLAEKPGDRERMRNVALVGRNFGGLLTTLKRPDEARPLIERALALDQQRMAAAPDDRMAQLDTAIEYSQLATLSEHGGDIPAALALHEKSLALRQRLADSDPKDVLTRNRVAWTRSKLARLHLTLNDARRALPYAQGAVADLESIPDQLVGPFNREDFGAALEALGEAAWAAGDRAAGCRHFARAIEVLAPHPQGEKNYYLRLARTQAAKCGPAR